MKAFATKLGVVQNLGLTDRTLRLLLAMLLLGGPVAHLTLSNAMFGWWQGMSMLLSIYPALTGLLGWDPLYQTAGIKSCDLSDRNRCGTLPYQIDAALGHHPVPETEYDHSLAGSHH